MSKLDTVRFHVVVPCLLGALAVCMLACGTSPTEPAGAASHVDVDPSVGSADGGGDPAADAPDTAPSPSADTGASAAPERGPRPVPPPTFAADAPRIVAIGDLHGDVTGTRKVLKLAGAIDDQDKWIGGKLVVVQVGDQLDRGDDEKSILLLLHSVAQQAHEAGGALYALNGNHETMNVARQFNYVTPGGWLDFSDVPHVPDDDVLAPYPLEQRGRVSALRPGGPYAKQLAGQNTIQLVGKNVFVHGGVLPQHVSYGVQKINSEISAWMRNEAPRPDSTSGDDCPVWSRHYSLDVDDKDCQLAATMLAALGAKRIIVAHTVQSGGINSVCGGTVWRVDVGIAKHYGGTPQVLVIEGDSLTIEK